jgi:hypothetical protein
MAMIKRGGMPFDGSMPFDGGKGLFGTCAPTIETFIHFHTKNPNVSRNLRYDPLSFAVE